MKSSKEECMRNNFFAKFQQVVLAPTALFWNASDFFRDSELFVFWPKNMPKFSLYCGAIFVFET